MPRPKTTTLSVKQAASNYMAFDAACRQPDAERCWLVTVLAYWEWQDLAESEGGQTDTTRAAWQVVEAALDVTATLVYRDLHVQKRWRNKRNVRNTLLGMLPATSGGPIVIIDPNMRLDNPRGQRIGGTAHKKPTWTAEQLRGGRFAEAVKQVKARLENRPEGPGRPAWIVELGKDLLVSPGMVRHYLHDYPDLRQMLIEAGGPGT